MKRIDGKIHLEQGDLIKLIDGREAEFISFNIWDTGLMYVIIGGIKDCIFTNLLDFDYLDKMI